MFGLGMSEILIIAVVALLVLGPDKLPQAAKTLSRGIRDLRKQGRAFKETIEVDTDIGGAFRDLNSALRGELPVDTLAKGIRDSESIQEPSREDTAEETDAAVPSLPPDIVEHKDSSVE